MDVLMRGATGDIISDQCFLWPHTALCLNGYVFLRDTVVAFHLHAPPTPLLPLFLTALLPLVSSPASSHLMLFLSVPRR